MDKLAYKKYVSEVFDRSADKYGRGVCDFFNYFGRRLVDIAAIAPKSRILDVATGRGAILKNLISQTDPSAVIYGVDISPEMVKHTSEEVKAHSHVNVAVMDGENLLFPDHHFDYVFCGFALFFFPDVNKALKEFHRVLKPQGKFYASMWDKSFCQSIYRETMAEFNINSRLSRNHLDDQVSIRLAVAEAGFKNIEIINDDLHLVYPTLDSWFDSLWTHGSRNALEKLSPEQLVELKQKLEVKLGPYVKPNGLHDEMSVYYVTAVKGD